MEANRASALGRRSVLGAGLGLGAALVTGCAGAPPSPAPSAAPGTPDPPPSPPPAPPPSSSRPAAGPATQITRSSSGRPEIALTFHGAGELPITRQVLDVLARHDVKVTVLAVGTWLTSVPDAIRAVRDGGHEIGNHTWSHGDLAAMRPAAVRDEIERCRDRLAAVAGTPGAFFRQSQGQYATATELAEAGRAGYDRVLSYDVDSLDWTDPGPARIRAAVAAAKAGSIVSMHLGHPGTVAALPLVLTDLAGRGLKPVTAGQLLT
ncbi:polysaccharide deacetylase family protein [Amycolatopsis pigmentata]|uniref:Polysaccharide deacetylase family protein n=1 Tax=Amycolatopsis pigmentata TaxID=450801 RepID=A0ABW5FQA1_9PSEU